MLKCSRFEENIIRVLKKPLHAFGSPGNSYYVGTRTKWRPLLKLMIEVIVEGTEFGGLILVQEVIHRFRRIRD